jgi:hypothetical protein
MYKLEGILESINDTKKVSDKFSMREFIVKDITNVYPQDIVFQLTQEKCVLLDNFKIGDVLEITFNINGKRWESPTTGDIKYFNSLVCWRIEESVKQPIKTITEVKETKNEFTEKVEQSVYTIDDDLPF